jgi:hypothetical protein
MQSERGASLVLAMAVTSLLGVFGASTLAFGGVGSRSIAVSTDLVEGQYAADAGVEWALQELAASPGTCDDSGETFTWPASVVNGETVTYRCEWLAGGQGGTGPRTVRVIAVVATSTGAVSTLAAVAQPDAGPTIASWERYGQWTSPGPATTTTTSTTAPPTTTTTAPPTTTTTAPPTTTTTAPPTTTTTAPPTTTTTAPPTTTTTAPPTTTTTAPPTTTTTAPPSTTTTTTVPTLSGARYLKSSATGNVVWSTPLPFSPSAPTASSLPNYDVGRDTAAGLLIQQSTSKATESNTARFQEWSLPIASSTRIAGNVSMVLWSGMKSFATSKRGVVIAYLRDCNSDASSCTELANATVDRANWQGTSSTWVSSTFDFGTISRTLAAGRTLRVKVTVDNSAADDMWFAYDTTALPSRLIFG